MHGRIKPLALLLVSLCVLALLGGFAFYRPFQSEAGVAPPAQTPKQPEPEPPPSKLPGKRQTFLVMGVDDRPGLGGRSDSMFIASYDPAKQRLAVLSLPRDSWVEIPGHGFDKVNHAYAFGGERLAIQTVQRWLDIPIDHYVTISFQGFIKIVDALGGVEIDAEKRMYYVDPNDTSMGPEGLVIDIQPGPQEMDGLTALKYARFRMDEEGDFGRMRRQQQVMKALMRKAVQLGTVARIPQVVPALADAIRTDLSIGEMVKLASGAQQALRKPLETGTLEAEPAFIGPVYYLLPDLVQQRTTAYQLLVGEEPTPEFLARAEQAQAAYQAALEEALARAAEEAERAAEAAAQVAEEAREQSADGTDSDRPDSGDEAGDSGETTGATKEKTGAGDGSGPDEGPGDADGPPVLPPQGSDGPADGDRDGSPSGDQGGSGAGDGEDQPPGEQDRSQQDGGDASGDTAEGPPAMAEPVRVAVVDASGAGLSDTFVQRLTAAGFQVVRWAEAFNTVSRTVVLDHAGDEEAAAHLQHVFPGALVVAAPDPNADAALEIILGEDLIHTADR